MNTEIEMKAWVQNISQMQNRISALPAEHIRSYQKFDIYFHLMHKGALIQALRIREDISNRNMHDSGGDQQISQIIVTCKNKQVQNGLEVSEEREFTISHKENFVYFLKASGYREFIQKTKTGNAYRYGNFLLELSQVDNLGAFIEIEYCRSGASEESEIAETDAKIREVLERLGIDASQIEERSYTELLFERRFDK